MKTLLKIATLSLGLSLLAGCASTQETTYRDAPPEQRTVRSGVDEAYVARVEQIARSRGTRVMWVNQPRKPVRGTVAAVE